MQAKLKDLWVKALRGEGEKQYEQGKNYLRCGDKYCCLGVLCDILGCEWTDTQAGYIKENPEEPIIYDADDEYSCELPPEKIGSKIGPSPKNYMNTEEVIQHLSHMNDSENKKFYEISNWIEDNL